MKSPPRPRSFRASTGKKTTGQFPLFCFVEQKAGLTGSITKREPRFTPRTTSTGIQPDDSVAATALDVVVDPEAEDVEVAVAAVVLEEVPEVTNLAEEDSAVVEAVELATIEGEVEAEEEEEEEVEESLEEEEWKK